MAVAPLLLSCGTERGFSGVWQQDCETDSLTCLGSEFVFALHLGRYGDDVTGLAVRYLKAGAGLGDFDSRDECGCFVIDGGRVRDGSIGFRIELEGPCAHGLPAEGAMFDSATCRSAIADPPCRALSFTLDGDEDRLRGVLACDGQSLGTFDFVPKSGRVRRTCLADEACESRLEPDAGSGD